ncbi:hypothetical protein [Chenggangzhangella methanolivorans]|uniref:Uncharacterized protein n=1 Tax=Chenggangzhangella methanolivorans TaxID=1437009 RepID=A0A9E6RA60_9HYPH|nr:hypothetical protein [Chenggangzhangella methanolivorans]QZN99633.1 hypothetical protein K6K41_23535 [Chenggangzhangella methanolivorans]
MSTVIAIDDLLERGAPVTLGAVGGRAAVEADLGALLASPHVDVMVGWAVDAAPGDESFTDDLVIKGFQNAGFAVTLRAASHALIASAPVRTRLAPRIGRALEKRSEIRGDERNGLVAAYALETWLRLALAEVVQRHRLVSILVDIETDENGLFAEHAAKIVGTAFHAWRENDLLPVLDRLRRNPEASGEATFEYANALLSVALDGDDQHEVMGGLETAQVLFAEAGRIDADRSDAHLYAAVIGVVRGFAQGAGEADLDAAVKAVGEAAADRAFLLSAGRLPDWLAPRWDRDVQWLELVDSVPRIACDLGRPSWLRACAVLDGLLKVYDADRTIPGAAGFGAVLRPRIEASFVRERGLLAHLDDRLGDEAFVGADRNAAVALRRRIEEIAAEPNPPGKFGEGAFEKLRGALEEIGATERFIERVTDLVDSKLLVDLEIANPVVQRLFNDIRSRLEGATHYEGRIRVTFDRLLLQVILFCMDRQDAAKRELGPRGAYLFEKNAVEGDLQKDLRDWLKGNMPEATVLTEIEGIAKGRCDVYVGHGGWRFLVELKRHEDLVTPEEARKYVGQAASYQGTNVKLGMLGILELVDRTGPPPGLESCLWYDSLVPEGDTEARHLVIFRVPGRLRRPNELSR